MWPRQTLVRDKGKLAQLRHRGVSAMETRTWPSNMGYVSWRPRVDSNPRYRRERPGVSSLRTCALGAGLRGNKNAKLKRRLTNGLGKTWSQNRTFG